MIFVKIDYMIFLDILIDGSVKFYIKFKYLIKYTQENPITLWM